jgi:hypothetical protein
MMSDGTVVSANSRGCAGVATGFGVLMPNDVIANPESIVISPLHGLHFEWNRALILSIEAIEDRRNFAAAVHTGKKQKADLVD